MDKQQKVKLSRRDFLKLTAGLSIAGSAASLLSACGVNIEETTVPATSIPATSMPEVVPTVAGPKVGGESIWAHEIQVTSLNPITSPEGSFNAYCELAYEGLTEFDSNLNIVPALAESWETPDENTFIFHLRQNTKWHDGSQFSANDVKYTFDYIINPDNAVYWRANFDQVDHIEVIDDHTVKFITSSPYPALLGALAIRKNSCVVKQGAIELAETNTKMNGTGPYKQMDYVPDNYMKLERNAEYWGTPIPYIESFTYKSLPDEDARVAALRNGQVDFGRLTPEGSQRLQSENNLHITSTPGMRIIALKFNMNWEPWNNMRIRQAVALAIDRQEIIDKALSGAGSMSGPVPPVFGEWSLSSEELSNLYKFDLEQAKQILAEEGYTGDNPVDFLTAPWSVFDVPVATVVAEQLRRAGINVEIRQVETGVYSKEENPPAINFDLAIGGFSARHDPDGYVWQRLYTDGGNNPFSNGYVNTEMDDILSEARQILDVSRRKELYTRAQQIAIEEAPFCWLVVPNVVAAVNNRIKDYTLSPLEYRGWGITHSWIEDAS